MRRILLALSALLLTAGMVWAQSNVPPGLVEASRKARAARAKRGTQSRIFTNDSLLQLTGGISSVGGAEAGSTTAAPAAEGGAAPAQAMTEGGAAGEAAGEKKDECNDECWRKKFAEHRAKIAAAKRELDILQREYNLARTQYYQDPNQAVREQYSNSTAGGRDLQRLLNSITEKQGEIANLERGLSTLEDDLRRAGGNPGLARE